MLQFPSQQKTIYPISMYKANTDAPKRIKNLEEENAASADGWSTTYIHYEYPKWINLEDGSTRLVKTEEEHTAIKLAEDSIIDNSTDVVNDEYELD